MPFFPVAPLPSTLAYAPQIDVAIGLLFVAAVIAAIVFIARFAVRHMRRHADVWPEIYAKAEWKYLQARGDDSWPDEPSIDFVFYTYSGVLAYFTQTTHKLRLPARHAAFLAEALHAYNLKACLVPYPGIVYVPLLSRLNLRKVRRGLTAAANQRTVVRAQPTQ